MRSSQDLVTKHLAVRNAAEDQLPPLGPAVWTAGSQSELTPSQSLITSDEVSLPSRLAFCSPHPHPLSCLVHHLHLHNKVCSEVSFTPLCRPPPCFYVFSFPHLNTFFISFVLSLSFFHLSPFPCLLLSSYVSLFSHF